ncbi:type 4a pilus biogenesis protein PilO [Candidatus Berkelbacteria bacterium]|nr:type 4a pilus biogenesis protein PilO [Candidatus Berkelbacteria bacterium]
MVTHERQLLIALLAVLLSFSIGYFWFAPSIKAYQSHRLAMAVRTEELLAFDQRKADLLEYEQVFTEQQVRLKRLDLAVPTTPSYPELLTQTKTLVEQAGLTLTNFQPGRGSDQQTELVVTLTVRGTYPRIVSFTDQLEDNLRPARVQTLNLVRSGQTNETNDLAATLQIRFVQLGNGGPS